MTIDDDIHHVRKAMVDNGGSPEAFAALERIKRLLTGPLPEGTQVISVLPDSKYAVLFGPTVTMTQARQYADVIKEWWRTKGLPFLVFAPGDFRLVRMDE